MHKKEVVILSMRDIDAMDKFSNSEIISDLECSNDTYVPFPWGLGDSDDEGDTWMLREKYLTEVLGITYDSFTLMNISW